MERLCKCGCSELIVCKKHHKYYGIPKYIWGHNRNGKKLSKEHKRKIGDSNRGKSHKSHMKGLTFEEAYGIKKAKLMKRRIKEAKEKYYKKGGKNYIDGKTWEGFFGKARTKEMKKKLIKSTIGRKSLKKGKTFEELYGNRAKSIRKKISKSIKKMYCSGRVIHNNGKSLIEEYGKDKAEKIKEKQRNASKKRWGGDYYKNTQVKKILNGLKIKPNKPEKIVINLIQQNNLNFVYVGDGKKIIGGFNPDFIHKDKRLIIEVNGNYWHNLPKVLERDKRKMFVYENEGYSTLTIWEKELKDLNKVTNKISNFEEVK